MTPRKKPVRIWQFAGCELNESTWELRVEGEKAEPEAKPLEVLRQLLIHPKEVVSHDELFGSVWTGSVRNEYLQKSLFTAISKLRKVLPETEPPVIVTVPKYGYRMGVPVVERLVDMGPQRTLDLKPGDTVAERENWRLEEQLPASSSEVWTAKHIKTGELRVFKFALDAEQLEGLKREVTLSRYFMQALAKQDQFVRVLEWNFDREPYLLESAYGGLSLPKWLENMGGIDSVPMPLRLAMLAAVAEAVATAHELGVLHKDLKPGNILVSGDISNWQIKVADFGSAALDSTERLQGFQITNLGFPEGGEATQDGGGTWLYTAPEVRNGGAPTASADVFAMGVMLYQLVVGDMARQLTVGWEGEVDDPLLREDIERAVAGDPARRLTGAAELAQRLNTLDERRRIRSEAEADAERVSLIRRRADTARKALEAENLFLTTDIIARANPLKAGQPDETVTQAVERAAPLIDVRFREQPLVAAELHGAVATAFDARHNVPVGTAEYDRAAALFEKAEGRNSFDYLATRLAEVSFEARSEDAKAQKKAQADFAELNPVLARSRRSSKLEFARLNAEGLLEMRKPDLNAATKSFGAALKLAEKDSAISTDARLQTQLSLSQCLMKTGKGDLAEQQLMRMLATYKEMGREKDPSALVVRLRLAQTYLLENKFPQSVEEATSIYPKFVSTFGEDHDDTLLVLGVRAASEGMRQDYASAAQDALRIAKARLKDPDSYLAAGTLADAAHSECRNGDYKEGEAHARQAAEIATRTRGARALLTQAIGLDEAECLIGLKRSGEAGRFLEGIDVAGVSQMIGANGWGANVTMAKARVAFDEGDYDAARKLADEARPFFADPNSDPYQYAQLEKLDRDLSRVAGYRAARSR